MLAELYLGAFFRHLPNSKIVWSHLSIYLLFKIPIANQPTEIFSLLEQRFGKVFSLKIPLWKTDQYFGLSLCFFCYFTKILFIKEQIKLQFSSICWPRTWLIWLYLAILRKHLVLEEALKKVKYPNYENFINMKKSMIWMKLIQTSFRNSPFSLTE